MLRQRAAAFRGIQGNGGHAGDIAVCQRRHAVARERADDHPCTQRGCTQVRGENMLRIITRCVDADPWRIRGRKYCGTEDAKPYRLGNPAEGGGLQGQDHGYVRK
jgi:hypothetical protein